MKFVFFNDTGRIVDLHPALALNNDIECDPSEIKPLEERIFIMPDGTYPWVKLWDYGSCLQLLIQPRKEEDK